MLAQDGIEHATPPLDEATVVEDMLRGVLDAAGEEVLVLRSGEQRYDKPDAGPLTGEDEEVDEGGRDGTNRGGVGLGEV